jgi:hypothetical protein
MNAESRKSEAQGSLTSIKNVFTFVSSGGCYVDRNSNKRGEFGRASRPRKTYRSSATPSGRSLGAIHNIQ